MIKIENEFVSGFDAALRGMRNPKDSWEKSDSKCVDGEFVIGPNDMQLAKSLHKGGPVHSKFKRMIHVSMDVTAPLYWWKDYDTYKVATVANSCSTMHKIHAYPINISMFSTEHLTKESLAALNATIEVMEFYRKRFVETKNKEDWWQIIQLLPTSFNQKRTLDFNYETISNILMWRWNHKQDEWVNFCKFLITLPYVKDFAIPEAVRDEILEKLQ